jgi:hypothetical protein
MYGRGRVAKSNGIQGGKKYSKREGESEKLWKKGEMLRCMRGGEGGHRFVRRFPGFARSSCR